MRPARSPRVGGPRFGSRALPWILAAATVLPALLIGAAPTGPGPLGPSPATGVPGSGAVLIAPAFVPTAGSSDLGPLPPTTTVSVAAGIAPRDPAGLAAWTALEYTPGSEQFRHFLTPSEIADRFGPDPAAYDRAVAYFASFGLTVLTSPDHLLVVASGPSAKVSAAFHTSFERYVLAGREVFSHPTAATLPGGVPWSGAVGLGNVTPPQPFARGPPTLAPHPLAGCSSTAPYAPCAIEAAYNASGLLGGGTNGTGVRIGIVDVYDGSENQTTLVSDLKTFTTKFGLVPGTVRYVYPVPTTRNLNATSTGWGAEEALDLQWSRAMAPGAQIDMTLAPDPTTGLYGSVDWLVAHASVDVISLSWGEPDVGAYNTYATPCSSACNATSDGSYTLLHPVLADAVAEGIGVFSASGDCGAAEGTQGVATSYPASDPDVTGVGGTVLTMRNGSYSSESGWSGNASGATSPGCQNQGGSGGGYAPFPRPYWQRAAGLPASPATRGVPDVAMDAGSGVTVVYNGFTTALGGTSVGSPIWAGFEAIADQKAGGSLGGLAPVLYRIANGPGGSTAFHDITTGFNGYVAGAGWDAVTGLGTPNLGRLVPLLSAGAFPSSTLAADLSGSPRAGGAPLTATFHVNATGGSGTYPLIDVDFGDGNASLAPGGTVAHTYPADGVFVARATVFDASGNSSVSSPLAVVVGGGGLTVTLTASRTSATVGQTVNLTANVTGGLPPYRFWFTFGDGTYLDSTVQATTSHSYPRAGGYCVAVVAADSAIPAAGGLSDRVGIAVGGGSPPTCGNAPVLTANLTASATRVDLPGDLTFHVTTTGGTGAVTVHYVSDDPYVTACDCGIFHVPGNHTVDAFVNDSRNQGVVARLNVTILPALTGTFTHTALTGPPPFAVTFTALALGGDGTGAGATRWTFGDGGSAVGANVSHTYSTPGFYVVLGQLNDSTGGRTSSAFLVDVLGSSAGAPLAVGATVSPAVGGPAGAPVTFTAFPSGGSGPYTVRWDLGDNDSAFGPSVAQTFPASACLAAGTCPLSTTLTVVDRNGSAVVAPIVLAGFVSGQFTALTLTDAVTPSQGATPLAIGASANATGLGGLSYAWAFGDGTRASGPTSAHTFYAPGNFTVSVTVTDPEGDRLVRTHAVVVSGATRTPPLVHGGPVTAAGIAPYTVAFQVNGTGGLPPYTFTWSFGDGATGLGASINHTYVAPGVFSAEVTMTDSAGGTNRSVFPVFAYAATPVNLTAAAVPASVEAGAAFELHLTAIPSCGAFSPPPCLPSAIRLAVSLDPPDGGAAVGVGTWSPGVAGGLIVDLTAPSTIGAWTVRATAIGPNFTGSVDAPLPILAAATTPHLLPYSLAPPALLGVALLAGGALALVLGRRALGGRPTPSRPRGASGARRGASGRPPRRP